LKVVGSYEKYVSFRYARAFRYLYVYVDAKFYFQFFNSLLIREFVGGHRVDFLPRLILFYA